MIYVPKGATPCHIGPYKNKVYIWMEVNPDATTVREIYYVAETGEQFDSLRYMYMGSVQDIRRDLILHVLKKIERN